MKYKRGFTVVELLIVITLLGAASIIFFVQKSNVEVAARDATRKTAINAMYYSLEEVYFKEKGNYPRTLSAETVPSVDPTLFNDPSGVALGESSSNYRYEGTDCNEDSCSSYELRTTLENEADYIKKNRS